MWPREMWYPSDGDLRREMFRMTPNDLLTDGDTGFPTHATTHQPPLLTPVVEDADSDSASLPEPVDPDHYDRHNTPSDSASERKTSADDNTSQKTSSDEAATRTSRSDPTTSTSGTAVDELAQDIERRATEFMALAEEDLTPKFVIADSFGSDDELAEGPGTFRKNLETCAVCDGPQHELFVFPSIAADSGVPLATLTAAALNSVYYYLDDVIWDPELIPANLDTKQSPEMRQFLREVLGPVLDALLTLSPPDATRYLDLIQTAHDVRETFQSLAETLEKHQFGGSAAAASALMSELDAVLGGKQDEQNLDSTATDLTAVNPAAITGSPLTEANLVTHTADVATPSFDYRQGRPIVRAWSSSSGSRASSSDSYEVLYDRPCRLVPPLQNHLSPAITEWSVTSSDFHINPNNVINEAVSRVFADLEHEAPTSSHFVDPSNNVQSLASHEESLLLSVEDVRPILESFHHYTAHSDSANSSLPANASEILTAAADSAGQPSLFQSGEATSARIYSDLRDWVQRGVEHQDEHIRAENRVCGAPLQHVLEVVHRDLRDMVDYTAMVAQDLARFRLLSSVTSTLPPLPGPGIPPSYSPPSTTFEYTELSTPPLTSTDSGHDFESATASRIKNSSVMCALTDLTENLNQSSGGDVVAESATSDTIGNKRINWRQHAG
ncbi:hypothetical protein B0H17DRAFT_1129017 [Mycena rosella]|uniref:Uncharacterized protein n=1 Tax=Mycena rosella TaxID=1033263 RepID=A0AAD7DX42_MYCRO|nr:hypothetical protein B0H17DRAFT_1129017 [Mycena rosella]